MLFSSLSILSLTFKCAANLQRILLFAFDNNWCCYLTATAKIKRLYIYYKYYKLNLNNEKAISFSFHCADVANGGVRWQGVERVFLRPTTYAVLVTRHITLCYVRLTKLCGAKSA